MFGSVSSVRRRELVITEFEQQLLATSARLFTKNFVFTNHEELVVDKEVSPLSQKSFYE